MTREKKLALQNVKSAADAVDKSIERLDAAVERYKKVHNHEKRLGLFLYRFENFNKKTRQLADCQCGLITAFGKEYAACRVQEFVGALNRTDGEYIFGFNKKHDLLEIDLKNHRGVKAFWFENAFNCDEYLDSTLEETLKDWMGGY